MIVRRVEPGQLIDFADVEIPDSLAEGAWGVYAGGCGSQIEGSNYPPLRWMIFCGEKRELLGYIDCIYELI